MLTSSICLPENKSNGSWSSLHLIDDAQPISATTLSPLSFFGFVQSSRVRFQYRHLWNTIDSTPSRPQHPPIPPAPYPTCPTITDLLEAQQSSLIIVGVAILVVAISCFGPQLFQVSFVFLQKSKKWSINYY